ncbi:MAG: S-layer homology domain-containing protein [Clostridiales bacterium]|nr:S-layer homology domain-containing protein [Clostridiales bacterium]
MDKTRQRAMTVTVLGRLSNAAQTYGNDPSAVFGDVDNNDYYAPYVGWATEKGIVEGYGDGKLGTNDEITAKQLQLIISRYAKTAGIDFSYDDSAPDTAITRGEFAETLYNALISTSQQNMARPDNFTK